MFKFIKQVYKQCLTPLPSDPLPVKAGKLESGELVVIHPSGQVQIFSSTDACIIYRALLKA